MNTVHQQKSHRYQAKEESLLIVEKKPHKHLEAKLNLITDARWNIFFQNEGV